MTYTPPLRIVNTARRPYYKDATGQRIPGVTSILSDGVPKANLINWAANATAEYAVDRWDELSELSPSQRMKKLQGARYEDRDTAAKRGTEVHKLAEKLVYGEEVEVPDELAGHVESYVQLLDAWQIKAVLTEFVVVNYTVGYVGVIDLVGDVPGLRTEHGFSGSRLMVDTKTNRSGIFGETAWQLSAYRHAEFYIDPETGEEKPMFTVDGCAGIHVRADGADLIPITAGPAQFRDFRYIAMVAAAVKDSRDLIGAPLDPPTLAPRRRLEIAQEAVA